MLNLNEVSNYVKVHKIMIESLGGEICVRDLTLSKMEAIQKSNADNYVRNVIFHTVCNEDGSQHFPRNQDLNAFIEKMPMAVITEIMTKITEVVFPQKAVEEEAKN